MEVFDKKDIVFLAAESPNIINGIVYMNHTYCYMQFIDLLIELHEDKVYIIGGLVDHNFHKVCAPYVTIRYNLLYIKYTGILL